MVQLGKKLLFWNSRRRNGDAKKANHFLTLKREELIWSVAWISANKIAIGLGNGEIKICEIEIERSWFFFLKTTNSRVFKRFKHSESEGEVSKNYRRRTRKIFWWFSILFWVLKNRITDLKWNERTKYLASSSLDGWVKVISLIRNLPISKEELSPQSTASISFISPGRFGQWTATSPPILCSSVIPFVGDWLGVWTWKRTSRENRRKSSL